jgi:hypothetical protein
MPEPLAICLEDMDPQTETKYLRCVALPGRQPGLRLDEAGHALWKSDDSVSCELWVSADDRLILYRSAPEASVTLHRARRSLDVPLGKPVVVLDKDQIDVGAKRLRVHVHGQTTSVAAPSPLPSSSKPGSHGRLTQAVAAAAIIGAIAITGCNDTDAAATHAIDVIENPPEPAAPEPIITEFSIVNVVQGNWTTAQSYEIQNEQVWLTGTLTIEGQTYTFTPTREITGTSSGDIDFLFNHPGGEVRFDYAYGEYPDIRGIMPGNMVATCTFYANSEIMAEFQVLKGESDTLYLDFYPSSEDSLWHITKQYGD